MEIYGSFFFGGGDRPSPSLLMQFYSLAQNDSILQPLLEVWPDGKSGDVFNPELQLLFLLEVVLLRNLQ